MQTIRFILGAFGLMKASSKIEIQRIIKGSVIVSFYSLPVNTRIV